MMASCFFSLQQTSLTLIALRLYFTLGCPCTIFILLQHHQRYLVSHVSVLLLASTLFPSSMADGPSASSSDTAGRIPSTDHSAFRPAAFEHSQLPLRLSRAKRLFVCS